MGVEVAYRCDACDQRETDGKIVWIGRHPNNPSEYIVICQSCMGVVSNLSDLGFNIPIKKRIGYNTPDLELVPDSRYPGELTVAIAKPE